MPLRKPELLTPFELPLPVTKHRSPAQVGPGGLRSLGKPLVLRMSFRDSFTTRSTTRSIVSRSVVSYDPWSGVMGCRTECGGSRLRR